MHCNQQTIHALDDRRREHNTIKKLAQLGKKYNIHEVIPLKTSDICVAQWVRLKCKYGCKNYGTSWCCPPETPESDKTRNLLNEYEKALLVCGSTTNGHFHRDNQKKRLVQMNGWKGAVTLERRLFLEGYYKAFALVPERCPLCKVCTYPNDCKFPMERRPSVESCSIDVFQTLRTIGKDFRIEKDVKAKYNYYSIILLE